MTTLRSSASNPLRIDFVRVAATNGRIGMTLCPGKKQPVSMSGGWQRDLPADLDALRDWGASILVSLMEPDEFRSVGVSPEDLAREAASRGIEWIHIAIVDGSVPNEAALARWQSRVPHLRHAVEHDQSLTVHCLGGLGRTGTMAACLLIECGYAPSDAIAAVRAARPGTIENSAQEEFVLRYEPVSR